MAAQQTFDEYKMHNCAGRASPDNDIIVHKVYSHTLLTLMMKEIKLDGGHAYYCDCDCDCDVSKPRNTGYIIYLITPNCSMRSVRELSIFASVNVEMSGEFRSKRKCKQNYVLQNMFVCIVAGLPNYFMYFCLACAISNTLQSSGYLLLLFAYF